MIRNDDATAADGAGREILPIRLAFGPLFWRVAAATFVVRELLVWHWYGQLARWVPPDRRGWVVLASAPKSFYQAFLVAAIAAVLVDGFARLFLRRLAWRWYNPRRPEHDLFESLPFQLGAREQILAETPARRREGLGWRPGRLVLTDERFGFVPFAWDRPTWLVGRDGLTSIARAPGPRFGLGYIVGMPERLVFRDADGLVTRIAVADPEGVLGWLDCGPLA